MPLSGVSYLQVTGVDPQQVADRTVPEDGGCQEDEPEQSQQVDRGFKEKEQGKYGQAEDGPDDSFGFGADIVCHG